MSFPRYEKYKDSGVEWLGQIPTHWTVEELKYVCTNRPSNIDKKTVEGERPVLLCNYTDVYYNEVITSEMALMPATATDEQIVRFSLKSGDVIITKDSETSDDIAVASYVPKDLPGVVCGYHLAMIRPHDGICGKFIKRLFDSVYIRSKVATLANGLTRVGLSSGAIGGLELPIPPATEQHAIASFLDRETSKIDSLVAEQRRLVELLKEKRQAVISHAVTKGLDPTVPMKPSGIPWLGDVPAHWEVQRIKHVIRSIEQGWSPQCENDPVQSQVQWGVLKVGCVNYGKFTAEENKALPDTLIPQPALTIRRGDLLISRANTLELVGSAAVAERDYPNLMLCDKLYRLRVDRNSMLPEFLCHFLTCEVAREPIELGASGASPSMKNIAQSVILEMWLASPDVDEQQRIIDAIRKQRAQISSLITEAERAITLLQERRTALISAAITGKIDVRATACEGANR